MAHAKIIVLEVCTYFFIRLNNSFVYFNPFPVNFPVVSGGFALLKVASVVVPSSGVLPSTLLSTAVTFGPGVTTAGLLGKITRLRI